jgi:flagellar biosynthesis protein FlhG
VIKLADQAERLRALARTKEDCLPQKSMHADFSRVIAVVSGKGGVGKTNLVVNLALSLGQLGEKTIILDADVGLANVDILMGLSASASLADVLQGRRELKEVMLRGPYNVAVIPGGSALAEVFSLDSQQQEQLNARLAAFGAKKEGLLLVDCPAGISRNLLALLGLAGEVILLTTPEPTALADAYSMIKIMERRRLFPKIYLVVNLVSSLKEGERVFARLRETCRRFLSIEPVFLGSIGFDSAVKKAVLKRSPFLIHYPHCAAAQEIQDIARRLRGAGATLPFPTEEEGNILKRLLALWS